MHFIASLALALSLQLPRVPIVAESDSTFFLNVVDALTFRPDGLVLHQHG